MTEKERRDAIEYIEGQLNNGYIALDEFNYKNEIEVIKEAMNLVIIMDKFIQTPYVQPIRPEVLNRIIKE